MSEENRSIVQQFLAKREEWAAEQPSFGAELRAMAREAVKDVRQTLVESYFGQSEHMAEMGTPLNPTPQMTTQDLGTVYGADNILDRYSAGGRGHEEEQRGMDR